MVRKINILLEANAIHLNSLSDGFPGITPKYGSFLSEAAVVCLEDQNHPSGIRMTIDGDINHQLNVFWDNIENRNQVYRTWQDYEETTEYGAYGLAFLIVSNLTDYTITQRAMKGKGFDYWIAKKNSNDFLFQNNGRLEVSGIRKGDNSKINSRMKEKISRINKYENDIPLIITIIEFSKPISRVMIK